MNTFYNTFLIFLCVYCCSQFWVDKIGLKEVCSSPRLHFFNQKYSQIRFKQYITIYNNYFLFYYIFKMLFIPLMSKLNFQQPLFSVTFSRNYSIIVKYIHMAKEQCKDLVRGLPLCPIWVLRASLLSGSSQLFHHFHWPKSAPGQSGNPPHLQPATPQPLSPSLSLSLSPSLSVSLSLSLSAAVASVPVAAPQSQKILGVCGTEPACLH